LPRPGIYGRHPSFKIAAPAKQGFPNYWPVSGANTDPRVAFGFQNFVLVWFITK